MRPGAGPKAISRSSRLIFALVGASLFLGEKATAQAQERPPDTIQVAEPDTIPVDSTLLRIRQQLEGLAKPPGIDSTYFLPDSLMPDSLRERLEARSGQRSRGRASDQTVRSPLSGGDSILMALKELQGYTLTEYQSIGADFGAEDRQLVLLGTPEDQARIFADGLELTADSLFYDDEKGKVWSSGSAASFQPAEGEPVDSRIIVFDLAEERGTALDATTKYSGGGEWIVHGDLTSVTDTASFGNHLQFTSCELEEPHYHFASNNVKIVRGNLLVARPVKLYFADVPVAWLPFMVQNLEQGRSSGLLTPSFSINDIVRTSEGYSRRVSNLGFYWAMSEYYDATVFLDWWSGEHLSLTGSARFNWAKQFLTGNLSYRQFWREGGDQQRAINGSTQWQMSERTRLRFRGSYASSTSMIRRTSFDPREVVQSIDSEGGVTHRFGFGNLTLSANRKQYLSDDRVEMTLPNLSFSLSPMTFLRAPTGRARFYNNITWSGSTSFRRSTSDKSPQPDSLPFKASLADQVRTSAKMSSSLSIGNLSLGGGLDFTENLVKDVPVGMPLIGTLGPEVPYFLEDSARAEAGWNASLGYQQRLVGSSTLTPSLSMSGRMVRSDRDSLSSSFVSGPSRLSLGVTLRGDIYGFFPGFGSFEAIRHKMSPSFDYSYSPEVSPTDLQREVFGASEVGAQRTLRITLNQTFEAKLKEEAALQAQADEAARYEFPGASQDSLLLAKLDSAGVLYDQTAIDSLLADSIAADSLSTLADSLLGPTSSEPGQKVTILALRTTAVTYDFEKAKEADDWLWGIETTRLTNTISSDYLRGLNLTFTHDLFEDPPPGGGAGDPGGESSRKFSPHLSSMNFGFSLDGQSLPFRVLGRLLGGGEEEIAATAPPTPAAATDPQANPFAPSLTDEGSVIPGGADPNQASQARPPQGPSGASNWRANLSFSMQRPRDGAPGGNQMLQGDLRFALTDNWDVSWRTSYDLLTGSFNDHYVQLVRNLHRWEAHFDFRKTATGNWSFRFEVALTDQEDLHFDYSQRSYQDRLGTRRY